MLLHEKKVFVGTFVSRKERERTSTNTLTVKLIQVKQTVSSFSMLVSGWMVSSMERM